VTAFDWIVVFVLCWGPWIAFLIGAEIASWRDRRERKQRPGLTGRAR